MMRSTDPAYWTGRLRHTLEAYDESLLRRIAAQLFKPRSQWPPEELIERSIATLGNVAVVDRRLQAVDGVGRKLLALIGHSRQPCWRLGNLLELVNALGHGNGPEPIRELFDAGLIYPLLPSQAVWAESNHRETSAAVATVKSFEHWLGHGSATAFALFAHPSVTSRAMGEDLGLPAITCTAPAGSVHEADGLEWPIRLSALWQQMLGAPLRRTQQRDFFKRDLDRLREDALLNAAPADDLVGVPDAGLLAVALAQILDIVQADETELRAGALPEVWDEGLPGTLASLWGHVLLLQTWNPLEGWRGPMPGSPYPSAYLLSLMLLSRLSVDAWARPADLEEWICKHHPYWSEDGLRPSQRQSWLPEFLLGLAFQLRLVQAAKDAEGAWLVRLSPLGRWLLGLAEMPSAGAAFAQTLLVQPNLEIVVYRQGLTPGLVGRLSRFARWKSLGAACTLQLEAGSVYRGLESGLTFESILQTLEQHGMRATPQSVVQSLRTWADKRERITVYPTATLFEFGTAEEMNEALARGLPGVRLSDRLLVVANESSIDFRHFRLSGTRDYSLPPEKCVEVEEDGITLAIDLARSDLLLETEVQRFAETQEQAGINGRRRYRLTPASLEAGRNTGLEVRDLEDWFQQRTGHSLSPAARLLLTGPQVPPIQLRRQMVLHVATPELADGLLQWPGTRALIHERLGPTALAIAEEYLDVFRERLATLGTTLQAE